MNFKFKYKVFSFFYRLCTGMLFPKSALRKEEDVVLDTKEGKLIFRKIKILTDVLIEDAIKDIEKVYGHILYVPFWMKIEYKLESFFRQ